MPVLVMHGDDDQIVPFVAAGPLSAKILKNATLKVYPSSRMACPHDQRGSNQRRPAGLPEGIVPGPVVAATRLSTATGVETLVLWIHRSAG